LRNEPWSTPRANELLPFLDSAIAQLQSVLDQQPGADPMQITQCFTLACSGGSQIHDWPHPKALSGFFEKERPEPGAWNYSF